MPLLDTVLLSEEEGVEKPACEIFQRACQRLGVEPREALHVGDELEWCVAVAACSINVHGVVIIRSGFLGPTTRTDVCLDEGRGDHSHSRAAFSFPPLATTVARVRVGCRRCWYAGRGRRARKSVKSRGKT